ncbi:MAG: TonB family protein [Candidatus Omnitrophica bacterium]|nr:TonB family protein [Candidatus Omnitrophota bacterium]
MIAGTRAGADEVDTTKTNEAYLVKGELTTLKADGVTRLSLTDPEVADIVKAGETEILMVGQSAGQTTLFIWDKQGKRAVTVYVFNQSLDLVKGRIEKLFKAADISEVKLEIDGQEGKVVASGYIPKEKKERFDQIIGTFSQDVFNLVKDEGIDDLIQIDVQITELSTTLSKSLGINWTTGTGDSLSFAYPETLPGTDGSLGDLFKIGDFNRTSALLATVSALIAEGKARVLSQPKLVVKSGEEASFLVGGVIPVRTTTSTQAGGTQENVTFKSYGISMNITPEIKKEKIDITLSVQISDVDASNAVGDDVAFTKRSAQTKLYMDDGQTIVLAGLIKQNRSQAINKIPFLGDIPVVGLLFRKRSQPTSDLDQEVVISLTPIVLEKNRSGTPLASVPASARTDLEPAAAPEAQAAQEPSGGVEEVAPISEVQAPSAQESNPAAVPQSTSAEAGPEPAAVPFPKDMSEYAQAVQQKIAQAIVYPQEAEQSGLEGTVKLGLLILNDGTLATAMVRESSGYEVFDDYTLSIVKKLAPYSSFPSDAHLRELNLTIPVVYSLKKINEL